ncbi:MAG TPA: carbonic anhydrase, partial [Chthoniobacteraceae bacterium]
ETIVAWNARVTGGEQPTSWPADEIASALPVIALTCIDPRLNSHFPNALGLRPEQFIWLRNAGNVITGSTSSTTRSLALACAVKGGREIAIIGHTDCGVRKTGVAELTDRFRELGVPRDKLPHDLVEFFGIFASERQNVMRGVEFVRQSPIIGPAIPVHGLLIDVRSARLEWVVNGYDALDCIRTGQPVQKNEEPPPRPPEPTPLQLFAKPPLPKPSYKVVSFPPRTKR